MCGAVHKVIVILMSNQVTWEPVNRLMFIKQHPAINIKCD